MPSNSQWPQGKPIAHRGRAARLTLLRRAPSPAVCIDLPDELKEGSPNAERIKTTFSKAVWVSCLS